MFLYEPYPQIVDQQRAEHVRMAERDLRVAEPARGIVVSLVEDALLCLRVGIVAANPAKNFVVGAEVVIDAREPLPCLPHLRRLYQKVETAGVT